MILNPQPAVKTQGEKLPFKIGIYKDEMKIREVYIKNGLFALGCLNTVIIPSDEAFLNTSLISLHTVFSEAIQISAADQIKSNNINFIFKPVMIYFGISQEIKHLSA